MYSRWDISAVKRTRVVGHTMFEFRADLINALQPPELLGRRLPDDRQRLQRGQLPR
jgi:hypothetical protein